MGEGDEGLAFVKYIAIGLWSEILTSLISMSCNPDGSTGVAKK